MEMAAEDTAARAYREVAAEDTEGHMFDLGRWQVGIQWAIG